MTWYDLLMELKKKSWPRKMTVIDFAWVSFFSGSNYILLSQLFINLILLIVY
jgi:uncharacterized membrane protein